MNSVRTPVRLIFLRRWFLERYELKCLQRGLEALSRSPRLINWVVISYFSSAHPLRSTNNHCRAINTLSGNLAIRGINRVTFSARMPARWCVSILSRDMAGRKNDGNFWKSNSDFKLFPFGRQRGQSTIHALPLFHTSSLTDWCHLGQPIRIGVVH